MKLAILLITILLLGCTRTEYIKETVYINNTIFINKTIEIPCNLTCPECVYNYSRERELELIRRLKFLENQQDKLIINETECIDNNIKTNYEDKLNMYERDIEELEDELENCEEEICEYNSSWC